MTGERQDREVVPDRRVRKVTREMDLTMPVVHPFEPSPFNPDLCAYCGAERQAVTWHK